MENLTRRYARLSLTSILITSVLTTIHHYYRLGLGTLGLGAMVIGLPIAMFLWFRNRKTRIALIGYALVSGWIIVGFGLVDGLWDSALKLFLGNFLLVQYGQYFSWDPVGNFPFEATGVLAAISSLFAAYYLYRFLQSALGEPDLAGKGRRASWIPAAAVLLLFIVSGTVVARRTISEGATVPEDGVIKIGVIVPTTGPTALLAESFLKAVQVAREDMRLRSTEYSYVLVIETSSITNPLQTKAAIQKLIADDGVSAIIGGISASGQIVKPYVTAAGIPHICVCSIISIGDGEYNFTMIGIPEADAAAWVEEAQKRNIKTIALLTMEHESIAGHTRALKAAAEEQGMRVVYETTFDVSATDFNQIVAEAVAANPDVYFVETANPALDIIGQELRDAGVRNISSFVTPSLSAKPELYEGAWYADTNLVDTGFRERFEAKYPDTQFAVHMMPFAYDAFNLLVQGFESPEGAVRYIQDIREFESAAGLVKKDPGSGTFEPTPAIWVIRNGEPELLY